MAISKARGREITGVVLLLACLSALLTFFVYRETVSRSAVGELKTVTAPIRVLFQDRHVGTRITVFYGVTKVKMTLYGHRGWYVYRRGLPSFERVRRSLRPRVWVTLQYGNCVNAFGLTRYCDIFGIAYKDGRTLVTPQQVSAARLASRDTLLKFVVLGVFLTVLLGFAAVWCFRNILPISGDESADHSIENP
ncbi:MAG: hypothetical protein HOM58_08675 [Rhodospirillaceae bacterium]|jgi:hypothetical protein|nr:hypothetical protein [Rhodospirillaceae bacterium]MBT5455850.1 hypothetical protein [Rhodospirillaceae bacterium]